MATKKTTRTESELLLEQFKQEVERRGLAIYAVAQDMGVQYHALYYNIKPEKRRSLRKHPQITYDLGKKIERWLNQNKKSK